MNIDHSLFQDGTPRDQPYICPHCQRDFLSFRRPTNSENIWAPIVQRLTIDNARLTCGDYKCWIAEVDSHSEERIAYFSGIKRRKVADKAPVREEWE